MGTTLLDVYNNALVLLGERKLANLTQNSESRRVLDDVWPSVLNYVLEQGVWDFAIRIATAASTGAGTEAGFASKFTPPTDMIHLYQVGDSRPIDPTFANGGFLSIGGSWYADVATLYVQYTSNGNTYGKDLTKWSETFAQYVAAYLAFRACFRITGNEGLQDTLDMQQTRRLANAMATNHLWQAAGVEPMNAHSRWRSASSTGTPDKMPGVVPLNNVEMWSPRPRRRDGQQ